MHIAKNCARTVSLFSLDVNNVARGELRGILGHDKSIVKGGEYGKTDLTGFIDSAPEVLQLPPQVINGIARSFKIGKIASIAMSSDFFASCELIQKPPFFIKAGRKKRADDFSFGALKRFAV
jgi:hypothetical protein